MMARILEVQSTPAIPPPNLVDMKENFKVKDQAKFWSRGVPQPPLRGGIY